jgi:chaperonin GroES
LFGKYAGTNFKFEGKDFLVMREEDVVGIID